MDARGTIKAFDELFNGSTLKHIAYNYSQSEMGIRHPDGPVGIMARDQGQLDAYSGRSRTIWTVQGWIVSLAKLWAAVCDKILLRTPDIQSLKINGRHFNPALHQGQEVAAIKKSLSNEVGFVHKDLQIDIHSGRIAWGFLPSTDYLDPQKVFEEDLGDDILPSKDERRYLLWAGAQQGDS